MIGRALLVAALIASVACTKEDIVLASVPGDGSAATAKTCVQSSDCGNGEFCNLHHCGAEAGECEPPPLSCDNDEHPVCGCDGVTYFNDCLRRQYGIAGAEPEECLANPKICGTPGPSCPFCALFAGNGKGDCHGPQRGRCWVLPTQCPSAGRSDRWDECDDLGNPATKRCVSTCEAVRSGEAFVHGSLCQ